MFWSLTSTSASFSHQKSCRTKWNLSNGVHCVEQFILSHFHIIQHCNRISECSNSTPTSRSSFWTFRDSRCREIEMKRLKRNIHKSSLSLSGQLATTVWWNKHVEWMVRSQRSCAKEYDWKRWDMKENEGWIHHQVCTLGLQFRKGPFSSGDNNISREHLIVSLQCTWEKYPNNINYSQYWQ